MFLPSCGQNQLLSTPASAKELTPETCPLHQPLSTPSSPVFSQQIRTLRPPYYLSTCFPSIISEEPGIPKRALGAFFWESINPCASAGKKKEKAKVQSCSILHRAHGMLQPLPLPPASSCFHIVPTPGNQHRFLEHSQTCLFTNGIKH